MASSQDMATVRVMFTAILILGVVMLSRAKKREELEQGAKQQAVESRGVEVAEEVREATGPRESKAAALKVAASGGRPTTTAGVEQPPSPLSLPRQALPSDSQGPALPMPRPERLVPPAGRRRELLVHNVSHKDMVLALALYSSGSNGNGSNGNSSDGNGGHGNSSRTDAVLRSAVAAGCRNGTDESTKKTSRLTCTSTEPLKYRDSPATKAGVGEKKGGESPRRAVVRKGSICSGLGRSNSFGPGPPRQMSFIAVEDGTLLARPKFSRFEPTSQLILRRLTSLREKGHQPAPADFPCYTRESAASDYRIKDGQPERLLPVGFDLSDPLDAVAVGGDLRDFRIRSSDLWKLNNAGFGAAVGGGSFSAAATNASGPSGVSGLNGSWPGGEHTATPAHSFGPHGGLQHLNKGADGITPADCFCHETTRRTSMSNVRQYVDFQASQHLGRLRQGREGSEASTAARGDALGERGEGRVFLDEEGDCGFEEEEGEGGGEDNDEDEDCVKVEAADEGMSCLQPQRKERVPSMQEGVQQQACQQQACQQQAHKAFVVGVFFPLLAVLMPKWQAQLLDSGDRDCEQVVYLVSGVGKPRNPQHRQGDNSTETTARLMKAFLQQNYPNIRVMLLHSHTNIFRFDENIRFVQQELMPVIAEERNAMARAHGEEWRSMFHITCSFADGSPARISSINAALRLYRPSFMHIWEMKTFWHEARICEDDVEVHTFEDIETVPPIPSFELGKDESMVVREMILLKTEFADMVKRDNDLGSFWHRKTKKPVLAVLLVRKGGKPVLYRGTNMEVSMPTGSLCAERNVIGTALAADLTLRREDLKMVAVMGMVLPPLPPKGEGDSAAGGGGGWGGGGSASPLMCPSPALSDYERYDPQQQQQQQEQQLVLQQQSPALWAEGTSEMWPLAAAEEGEGGGGGGGDAGDCTPPRPVRKTEERVFPPPRLNGSLTLKVKRRRAESNLDTCGGGTAGEVPPSLQQQGSSSNGGRNGLTRAHSTGLLKTALGAPLSTAHTCEAHGGSRGGAASAASSSSKGRRKKIVRSLNFEKNKDHRVQRVEPVGLNPLKPCGACMEWLKKIEEVNPDFKVLTFTDNAATGVYVESLGQIT